MTLKRRKWLLALTCTAAAILLAALLFPAGVDEGPTYKGRPLSHWVTAVGSHAPELLDAESAIAEAGTNAMPWLLSWIQFEDKGRRYQLLKPVYSLAGDGSFSQNLTAILKHRNEVRAEGAMWTLQQCASNFPPEVVAELARLMNDAAAPQTAARATQVLGAAAPQGFRPLSAVLQDPQHPMRWVALMTLSFYRHLDEPAVALLPGLVACLGDTNTPGNAVMAGHILARLSPDSPQLLASLTDTLNQAEPQVRIRAAAVLGQLDEKAGAARHILEQLLTDPDSEVRNAAAAALKASGPPASTYPPPR